MLCSPAPACRQLPQEEVRSHQPAPTQEEAQISDSHHRRLAMDVHGNGRNECNDCYAIRKTTYGTWFPFPYLNTTEVLALRIEHVD